MKNNIKMKHYNRIPAEMRKRKMAVIKNNVTLEIMILFTVLVIIIVLVR